MFKIMWNKMLKNKNKNKPSEAPEAIENQKPLTENERENDENPEMVESDPDSVVDVEENAGKGLEKLIESLKAEVSDPELQQPVELVLDFITSLAEGVVDKEFLHTLRKGCSYDSDIEKARAEGEVAGRNAAIIEELDSRDVAEEGDGVPNLTGSFDSPYSSPGSSIFDIARSARI